MYMYHVNFDFEYHRVQSFDAAACAGKAVHVAQQRQHMLTRLMATPSSHPAIASPAALLVLLGCNVHYCYLYVLRMGGSIGAAACSSCCLGAAAEHLSHELPAAGTKN
jgi:hypothetical protein